MNRPQGEEVVKSEPALGSEDSVLSVEDRTWRLPPWRQPKAPPEPTAHTFEGLALYDVNRPQGEEVTALSLVGGGHEAYWSEEEEVEFIIRPWLRIMHGQIALETALLRAKMSSAADFMPFPEDITGTFTRADIMPTPYTRWAGMVYRVVVDSWVLVPMTRVGYTRAMQIAARTRDLIRRDGVRCLALALSMSRRVVWVPCVTLSTDPQNAPSSSTGGWTLAPP